MNKHEEFRQRVRDQEACRVTLVLCGDLLRGLREKLPNALPDHVPYQRQLEAATRNVGLLVASIVEHEL